METFLKWAVIALLFVAFALIYAIDLACGYDGPIQAATVAGYTYEPFHFVWAGKVMVPIEAHYDITLDNGLTTEHPTLVPVGQRVHYRQRISGTGLFSKTQLVLVEGAW